MNLTTRYMGLSLKSPIVPSASPLSEDIDNIKFIAIASRFTRPHKFLEFFF